MQPLEQLLVQPLEQLREKLKHPGMQTNHHPRRPYRHHLWLVVVLRLSQVLTIAVVL